MSCCTLRGQHVSSRKIQSMLYSHLLLHSRPHSTPADGAWGRWTTQAFGCPVNWKPVASSCQICITYRHGASVWGQEAGDGCNAADRLKHRVRNLPAAGTMGARLIKAVPSEALIVPRHLAPAQEQIWLVTLLVPVGADRVQRSVVIIGTLTAGSRMGTLGTCA